MSRQPVMSVAFAGAFAVRLAERARAYMDIRCDVVLASEADVVSRLADVDVLVTLAFTRGMGTAATPRLKLVQVPGAGLDRIDRAALPPGVMLANAYGHETGIAEYVIGAMLAWTREFSRLDASLRRGVWASSWAVDVPPPPPWPELAGKTLGILGYGRIGQCVARRAHALDMEIWAVRREPGRSTGEGLAFIGGPDALDRVLRAADYLVVCLPLTEATRGLLDAARLRLLKPTAVVVSVGRAEVFDEEALYGALAGGTIAGAALDVWYRYPSNAGPTFPSRQPFHTLPNVLMTPHVSGWTEGMLDARARLIAENVRRVARGDEPLNAIREP